VGEFLPRHLTDRAAALPHKAATPTVRHRGSYGPVSDSCGAAIKSWKLNGIVLVVPNLRQHLFDMSILAQLASDDVLDSAYEWLCRRRRDYSANSDVWSFRRCWQREKAHIHSAGSSAASTSLATTLVRQGWP